MECLNTSYHILVLLFIISLFIVEKFYSDSADLHRPKNKRWLIKTLLWTIEETVNCNGSRCLKKGSFSLRISSVNFFWSHLLKKSAMENFIFVQWIRKFQSNIREKCYNISFVIFEPKTYLRGDTYVVYFHRISFSGTWFPIIYQ